MEEQPEEEAMPHTVTLKQRKEYAGDVLFAEFSRPADYAFTAGQWCFLALPDRGIADERGLRRHLSITSAPEEDHLGFATKISASAFKQTLARIEIGEQIRVEAPKGRLQLPADTDLPVCFLAGGIGITPFRSLAVHSTRAATGHRITLLYSSRTPEEAVFLDEFQALGGENDRFRFVATMTRMPQSRLPWDGREGRMNSQVIREEFPEWERGAFYVAGPPNMVGTMLELLAELAVPEERITVEKFMGY
ncbi:MAG TPA: FAD-dependent oxidoreductase [Deferrisomatales bacterium]|nr:FAD-dependent oxidoreductase [Deferrisomatales bacterium]